MAFRVCLFLPLFFFLFLIHFFSLGKLSVPNTTNRTASRSAPSTPSRRTSSWLEKLFEKVVNSTKEPSAYIVPAKTVLDTKPAPFMALFSSRGPNTISPDILILKPDITAPGLNILAAWSEASAPTNLIAGDKRAVKYNIMSGTSMACPHIAGLTALLKAIHPDWSSAAIRSALMTSAGPSDNEGSHITDASGSPADPFQFGSQTYRQLN